MCAPISLGAHLWLNSLHDNPHFRVSFARRALAIEYRQTTILSPIPQDTTPHTEVLPTLTNLPVTTPPSTVLSPSESVSIPGLSGPDIQTLSSTMPTAQVASSTDIPSLSRSSSVVALPSVVSTVLSLSGSAAASSMEVSISTSSMSSTYDTSSSLVSTPTATPVTTITPVISQSSDSTVTSASYTSIQSTETDNPLSGSFTLAPSSTLPTVTDPSTSAITSSTTNGTAPAINTVVASPISVTPGSLSVHSPPFYIGIVLGTVAAIACLCALIAWLIRLRSHARRRRAAKSLNLPWAKSVDSVTWNLESGHGSGSHTDLAAISAMNLGSREDLAHVQAWFPRGDRDVGEPRRAESCMQGSTYSLQNHPIPEHCLFSDDSVRAFASSEGYSTVSLLPHHNLRQLPSHLIDQELAARVSREHASLRSNDNIDRMSSNGDFGTPRETMTMPRFLSLRGDGLNFPWHPNSERSPRSMVERLRNHRKPLPAEPPWQQISPLQSSGKIDEQNPEAEHWTTSFRTSLVSAFNAVAANFPLAAGAPHMKDDGFTPPRPKRMARKSVRDTFWDDNLIKTKELSRETSVSTVTSKAWTLEETREGAGVVRLFIPGLQEIGTQRPHLSEPTLSFGDGDDVISEGEGIGPRRTSEPPQVPLIASEKPPPAVMRPDPYQMKRNTRNVIESSLSRAGSNYSTVSMYIGAQTNKLPLPMTAGTGSLGVPSRSSNPYYDDSAESIVIQSSQISRLSSVSSTTSTILNGTPGVIEEGLNAASLGLKDRRNRILED